MSKPVKQLLKQELVKRFEGVTSLAVVGFTGIDAVTTGRIRGRLREKDIRMTVVKNAIARQAFEAVGLADACDLLDGPCAIAVANDAEQLGIIEIIRELMDIGKETPNLKVKAALMDGQAFGSDRVEALSKFPTRDEAVAKTVACVLAPGANLAGCLIGPGSVIAGLIKTIQDKKEDEGAEQAA